jgi:hypothetical protein
MKKLGGSSRYYIHQLTQVLFMLEKPPVFPHMEKDKKRPH